MSKRLSSVTLVVVMNINCGKIRFVKQKNDYVFFSTHFQFREEKNGRIFGNGAKKNARRKFVKKILFVKTLRIIMKDFFRKRKPLQENLKFGCLVIPHFVTMGLRGPLLYKFELFK